jgi:hypothetical protein
MNDELPTESLQYLLDDLDEVRRASFEARLEADPAAAAAFKGTADALADFALASSSTAVLPPEERAVLAAAVLAAASPVAKNPAHGRRILPWIWPVAAAFLLGLNLWQFFGPSARGRVSLAESRGADAAIATTGRPQERRNAPATAVNAAPEIGPAIAAKSTRTTATREGERMRAELSALQRAYDSLEVERRALATRLGRMARAAGSGIVAMELVDPERFAKGERKGLAALLQSLGTDPLDGPVALGRDGMSLAAVGIVASSRNDSEAIKPGAEPPPYAWSLFDATEHEGLVNLYNLPAVTTEELLALWVKNGDADSFRLVGEIPATLYGGSGTVFVTLGSNDPVPSEVLVTREKRGQPVVLPGETTVLRGP